TSLMEELEAVDWYNQRVDACKDPELRKILEHNRDEEKEHAAMVLEWIRRRDKVMDKELKDYLFTTKSFLDDMHHAHWPAAAARCIPPARPLYIFPPADWASLAVWLCAWLGYGFYAERVGDRKPNLMASVAAFRRVWMREAYYRDPRITDV